MRLAAPRVRPRTFRSAKGEVTLCVCGLFACSSRSSAVARWSRYGIGWPLATRRTSPGCCCRRRSTSRAWSACSAGEPERYVRDPEEAGPSAGLLGSVGAARAGVRPRRVGLAARGRSAEPRRATASATSPTCRGWPDSSSAWLLLLIGECAGNGSVVAGIGLIGLFPTGVPETRAERAVLGGAAATAVPLPIYSALMASPDTPGGTLPGGRARHRQPAVHDCGKLPGGTGRGRAAVHFRRVGHSSGSSCCTCGTGAASAADRRRIRWLLVGAGSALLVFAAERARSWLTFGSSGDGSRLGALGAWTGPGVRFPWRWRCPTTESSASTGDAGRSSTGCCG